MLPIYIVNFEAHSFFSSKKKIFTIIYKLVFRRTDLRIQSTEARKKELDSDRKNVWIISNSLRKPCSHVSFGLRQCQLLHQTWINIGSMMMQTQMLRKGYGPILVKCKHYHLKLPLHSFFASNANPHADVTCEHTFRRQTNKHNTTMVSCDYGGKVPFNFSIAQYMEIYCNWCKFLHAAWELEHHIVYNVNTNHLRSRLCLNTRFGFRKIAE